MTNPTDAPAAPVEEADGALRDYRGPFGLIVQIFCALVAVAHLYNAIVPTVSELERNALHFASFALLAALFYPAFRRDGPVLRAVDAVLGLAVAAAAIYLAYAETAIYARGVNLSTLDWIATVIAIVGAIELTRRLTGWIIPILIVLALTYVGYWGSLIGGVFSFAGLGWERIAFRSIYGDDAMFGSIASISSTYVFLFIIFGAFLIRSGAGEFVINMARVVSGKLVGGPGIVAVIASGLTGTISGSAVANTASTGVITIPLMKRAGFDPRFAGGVEAAASTGGQLMPPIMGAGAFVMAGFTQIPYETIIATAALPALLYFLSVTFFVRIEAQRQHIPPMEDGGQTLAEAFKDGGITFIVPITLLIGMLVAGFTPTYAAVFGILAVIVSSWVTSRRMGPRAIFEALAMGTRSMVLTAVLLCAVGLVINVIATAGVGNTFSLMIAGWAGGNLLIAITLVALASLVLGMGLPVTAAYIVLATLSAPALAGMIADRAVIDMLVAGAMSEPGKVILSLAGPDVLAALDGPMSREAAWAIVGTLPLEIAGPLRDIVVAPEVAAGALLSAHMIVFWLSQDSNVTPPVALASFTAAAIAKAKPMATAVASWKLAKGLYIVPVLFAYTPFLSGSWGEIVLVFALAVPGVYALAAAMQGCMENKIGIVPRLVLAVAGAVCIWPSPLWMSVTGVAVIAGLLAINISRPKSSQPGAAAKGAMKANA